MAQPTLLSDVSSANKLTEVDEEETLRWKLYDLQALIHLIKFGIEGKPKPAAKLPEYAKSAREMIDKILKEWDFPDLISNFPYPDEDEEEDDGGEYHEDEDDE